MYVPSEATLDFGIINSFIHNDNNSNNNNEWKPLLIGMYFTLLSVSVSLSHIRLILFAFTLVSLVTSYYDIHLIV
jgi:hypothetical protein